MKISRCIAASARRRVSTRSSTTPSAAASDRERQEHNVSNNQFAPGIGYVDNKCRAGSPRSAAHRCSAHRWSTRVVVGRAWNSFGFMSDEGKYKYDYKEWWRSNIGVDPPRLEPFGQYPGRTRPRIATRLTSILCAAHGVHRRARKPCRPARQQRFPSGNAGLGAARANRDLRWSFQDDLTWTRGRHNFKTGFYGEWASRPSPRATTTWGTTISGTTRRTRSARATAMPNALLGVFNTYTELTNRSIGIAGTGRLKAMCRTAGGCIHG